MFDRIDPFRDAIGPPPRRSRRLLWVGAGVVFVVGVAMALTPIGVLKLGNPGGLSRSSISEDVTVVRTNVADQRAVGGMLSLAAAAVIVAWAFHVRARAIRRNALTDADTRRIESEQRAMEQGSAAALFVPQRERPRGALRRARSIARRYPEVVGALAAVPVLLAVGGSCVYRTPLRQEFTIDRACAALTVEDLYVLRLPRTRTFDFSAIKRVEFDGSTAEEDEYQHSTVALILVDGQRVEISGGPERADLWRALPRGPARATTPSDCPHD